MLVGMGDLPQPDKGVLSTTLWQGEASPSQHRANSSVSQTSGGFPDKHSSPSGHNPGQLPPHLMHTSHSDNEPSNGKATARKGSKNIRADDDGASVHQNLESRKKAKKNS